MDPTFLIFAATTLGWLTVLLLVSFKGSTQRSGAMYVSPEYMEINFALREGYTIVAVIETAEGMCFVTGSDVRNEKSYE